MPISDKIKYEISNCHATDDEKELMYRSLKIEDQGILRFTSEYEKIIKEFIESHKEENNK